MAGPGTRWQCLDVLDLASQQAQPYEAQYAEGNGLNVVAIYAYDTRASSLDTRLQ